MPMVLALDSGPNNRVSVGSAITVRINGGHEEEFVIVHPEQSDPDKRFVSYVSPFGNSVMGAAIGERRQYSVRDKTFQVEVVKISALPGHLF